MDDYQEENEEINEAEQEEIRQKGDWNTQLIKASQKGDLEWAKRCLEKKANINHEDKKKWTPLCWAACKGHIPIVKLLIEKGAVSGISNTSSLGMKTTSTKVVKGIINNQIKQTPLQWACFKGQLQIVWLLLKAGLMWDEVDAFGNNCVHLAASGGNYEVFVTLMIFGASINEKNARGHSVKELATNQQTLNLIKQREEAEKIDPLKRFYCITSKQFYRVEEYRLDWVYENADSLEQEKPEGRCVECWENIKNHTEELEKLMSEQVLDELSTKIKEIETNHIEIAPKVMQKALYEQDKLSFQRTLVQQVNQLSYVENYKTILRSVYVIEQQMKEAKEKGIIIDLAVDQQVKGQIERLVSERNLRFELDNLNIGQAIEEEVDNLVQKMDDAKEKKVASEYLTEATGLKEKMARSINAKKIMKMFSEYPFREYPDPIVIDFKTKKPIDPVSKKPIDPLQLALNNLKKKKKKEPKFLIPEWANEIKNLEENVKSLEQLLKESAVLSLDEVFIKSSQDQIARMRKEIRYRKQLDEEARLIAEFKAAKKKQK